MVDSTIVPFKGRWVVRTGEQETWFGDLESAATQIAMLQQRIEELMEEERDVIAKHKGIDLANLRKLPIRR